MTARIEPMQQLLASQVQAKFSHPALIDVWASSEFVAQVYQAPDGVVRITVSRRAVDAHGRRQDAITWDELMAIKHAVGYADRWAVEIYPPDDERADGSAMHHLWVIRDAPAFAWTRSTPKEQS